jgi:hypothetical protein
MDKPHKLVLKESVMLRINHGFAVALIILLFASAHSMAQSDRLPPRLDSAKHPVTQGLKRVPISAQPFLPSIDDVIQKPGASSSADAQVCQLNPPLTESAETARKNFRLNNESMTKKYCDQMADLLSITLKGSQSNPDAQRRAIETALKMVSENATSVSESRIAELEVEQERLVVQMSRYINRASDHSQLFAQYKTWLQPIYLSQNRTHEQLMAISASHDNLKKTIRHLEQQITHAVNEPDVSEPVLLPEPSVVRNRHAAYEKAQALEAENLQKQLKALQTRIKELHPNPIRPASHLEPIYNPKQRLKPVLSTLKR